MDHDLVFWSEPNKVPLWSSCNLPGVHSVMPTEPTGPSEARERVNPVPTPAKPMPARALAQSEETALSGEDDRARITVSVEGQEWSVRTLGQCSTGGKGPLPMLLLEFRRVDEGEGTEAREVLTVGTSLDDLSGADVERAFHESAEPRPRPQSPSFFPEASDRRRR